MVGAFLPGIEKNCANITFLDRDYRTAAHGLIISFLIFDHYVG
jgi:hypothetical protein